MSLALSGPPANARVELQVGERRFVTLASTLSQGSSFFAALLSGRWEESQSEDGSYSVDADPDIFAHISRYLRRGVLPVVYEKSHGFDHAFYQALQEEAEYFGIEPLHRWLKEKGYLRAVTIQYSMQDVKGQEISRGCYNIAVDRDTERSYHPSWGTEKIYYCPRGIYSHHGNAGACGRPCEKAKGENGDNYVEEDVLRTLIVTRKVTFNSIAKSI